MSPLIERPDGLETNLPPATPGEPLSLSELGAAKDTSSPIRILVVEDNLETSDMIRHLLVQDGYEVIQLASGTMALERIAAVERGDEKPFEVALVDVMLPQVNGYEVCREIRRSEKLGYIPVIMVTALDRTEDMVRGLDLGADDYLIKPFNPRELLARVRAALRVRDADREMRRRNWQLAILNALNDAISGSLDGDGVLRAGLDLLLRHLDLGFAVVFLRGRRAGELNRILWHDRNGWWEKRVVDAQEIEDWRGLSAYLLAREVIESGRLRLQTEERGWPASPGQRQWRVYVPLKARLPRSRRVLGTLLVGAPADKPIIDVELLTVIGNEIGQALEKSHYFQQAQDRSEELSALYSLAQAVASTLDLDVILSTAMDSISQIVPVEAGALLLLRDPTKPHGHHQRRLKYVYTIRERDAFVVSEEIDPDTDGIGQVARQGQPLIVNDLQSVPHFPIGFEQLDDFSARSALYVPLLVSEQVVGVIELFNKIRGPFDEHDLDLVSSMAASVAVAIEKSRLFHDLAVAYDDLESSRQTILASRNRLQALFDSISDIIYVVDAEYRLAAVNAALGQWLAGQPGTPLPPEASAARPRADELWEPKPDLFADFQEGSGSVLGQICYRTLFARETPCRDCQMMQALRKGERVQWALYRRRPERTREEWEMSAYPIQGWQAGTSLAIVLARDVTEQRMLEASLSQSEKLASLGQLAAGLAHEINNPLTAIVANVELLLMDAEPSDRDYESLSLIKLASDRAVRVVRNLLDFARQEQYDFQATDLNATLRAALGLVRHQFMIAQVEVMEDLDPDLPPALVSRDHLQGVWLNLLLNARDAVTQHTESAEERRIGVGSRLREDGFIAVTIRDNGVGIPAEQLNRIFEPFFTTKDPGKGTGLGLSTSYHIVKQHGGEIQVDSEVGIGTIFTVLLPTAVQ